MLLPTMDRSRRYRVLVAVASCLLLPASVVVHASIDVDTTVYTSSYVPGGVQSGPDRDGSTYATQAVYSALDHAVLLTGTTHGGTTFLSPEQLVQSLGAAQYGQTHSTAQPQQQQTSCFVSALALPGRTEAQNAYYPYDQLHAMGSAEGTVDRDRLFWTRRQQLPAPHHAVSSCHAAHYFDATQRLVIAGHAEYRDAVTVGPDVTAEVTQQQGLLLDVEYGVTEPEKAFRTVGGQTLEDRSLLYPVAVAESKSDNSEVDGGIYVLFLAATHDATLLDAVERDENDSTSDSGYGMGLARFGVHDESVTNTKVVERFQQEWFASFDTTSPDSRVQLADLVHVAVSVLGGPASTTLLLAGSTDGEGLAYGTKSKASSGWDGFVTKVDILLADDSNSTYAEPQTTTTALRLESGRNKNDWVTHMCRDDLSSSTVYIVGTTEGTFSQSIRSAKGQHTAFIAKLNVETMDIAWIQHVGGWHSRDVVHGTACTVTHNGVWFGGVAHDGTTVAGVTTGSSGSQGGKDIFVAKLRSSTGAIEYLQQFGSDQDDELASHGGLAADAAGNAIVVGNTYGSLFRAREEDETSAPKADVFVFTISGFDGDTVEFPYASALHTKSHNGVYLMLLLLLAGITLLGLRAYMQAVAPKATDRSKVSIYLRKFNVEHIDLRHSATGGWHCHYMGRLAKGKMPKDKEVTILFQQDNTVTYDDLLETSNQNRGLLESRNNNDDSSYVEESESSYSESMDLYNNEFDPLSSNDTQVPASLWGKDIV